MSKRPSASKLKVGTTRSFGKQVYVVKTRKCHNDSHKRVKYWARATKAKRAAPTKRTTTRRKRVLRGGFDPRPILKALSDQNSSLMQYYKTIDLYNMCPDIARLASAKLDEFDADPESYCEKRDKMYKGLLYQPWPQLYTGIFSKREGQVKAIVVAHETYYGTPCVRDFECFYTIIKDGIKRQVRVMAAPTDSVIEAVQANTPWPVYKVAAGKTYVAGHVTTFAEEDNLILRRNLSVISDVSRVE